MIATLADAWAWYEAVHDLADWMDRIARRYWDDPRLDELLGLDNTFRTLGRGEIQDKARRVLEDLDDLAVLLLFSVFEAEVRGRTLEGVERELTTPPRHPALNDAIGEMKETIRNGSFGLLTRMYKDLDPDLKTQVDQVRKFRNWVAHGRRGEAENEVTPEQSRERLKRFLELLASWEPETPDAI
jgi:hypothetical protein